MLQLINWMFCFKKILISEHIIFYIIKKENRVNFLKSSKYVYRMIAN